MYHCSERRDDVCHRQCVRLHSVKLRMNSSSRLEDLVPLCVLYLLLRPGLDSCGCQKPPCMLPIGDLHGLLPRLPQPSLHASSSSASCGCSVTACSGNQAARTLAPRPSEHRSLLNVSRAEMVGARRTKHTWQSLQHPSPRKSLSGALA